MLPTLCACFPKTQKHLIICLLKREVQEGVVSLILHRTLEAPPQKLLIKPHFMKSKASKYQLLMVAECSGKGGTGSQGSGSTWQDPHKSQWDLVQKEAPKNMTMRLWKEKKSWYPQITKPRTKSSWAPPQANLPPMCFLNKIAAKIKTLHTSLAICLQGNS